MAVYSWSGTVQLRNAAGMRKLPKLADLILHERDQRRDHDREPVPKQRWQLVAERLAAAGRHHGQRVAALAEHGPRPRPARGGSR